MKKVHKTITLTCTLFIMLSIVLLVIINSNIPTKIACTPLPDCTTPLCSDAISCNNNIWNIFQITWIILSVLISLGAGFWFWKTHKVNK